MYDLTVDDIHTYYVIAGTTPVLVHNTNASCPIHGGPTGIPNRDLREPQVCTCDRSGRSSPGEENRATEVAAEITERRTQSEAPVRSAGKIIDHIDDVDYVGAGILGVAAIGLGIKRGWRALRKHWPMKSGE